MMNELRGDLMSVIIRIMGDDDQSDEYRAAKRMKDIIEETIPRNAMGEIVLFPSATLFGQVVKDIDVMMVGNLKNCKTNVIFNSNAELQEDNVYIQSFCTTIEVKSHSINSIIRQGTDFKVKYQNGWHNVTKQSNDQKISAMRYFNNSLGSSPFITNLIWFIEVTNDELNTLLTFQHNKMTSNVLPGFFSFKDIAQLLVYQREPRKRGNDYYFDSGFSGGDVESYSRPLLFFKKAKEGMGSLTRKKIEQITSRELVEDGLVLENDKLTIFRGKAGAGKTIDLIRVAINLVDKFEKRVQILTYNRALVSDIRRLFALAELPDFFQENCVAVNTVQSYFYTLIKECIYEGNLEGEYFLTHYEELLDEIILCIQSDEEWENIINDICLANARLNWEVIMIDEAQDLSEKERDLICLLFEKESIYIADGGQQFVRRIVPCDWSLIKNRQNVKLKYCLRQKNNLIKYVNQFSKQIYEFNNPILPSKQMLGGKVLIIKNSVKLYEIIKREMKELKKMGNIPYDMLFTVPYTMVDHREGKKFTLKNEFEIHGIPLWDGTNDDQRLEYSVLGDEARVIQYESARGLEGWTVCCLNYDEYLSLKEDEYNPQEGGDVLLLESQEEKRQKFILNWALIPLTRAIDTLIICLKDENSYYSKTILNVAEQLSDYVEII